MFATRSIRHKILYITDDSRSFNETLPIDERFVMRKQGEHKQAWPFLPSLALPLTFNGQYKGQYYLVAGRTGEPLDPLNTLSEDWKGKKLWSKITDLAKEEHHKVVSKVHESRMAKATVPLSIGAGILTVFVGLMAFMSR